MNEYLKTAQKIWNEHDAQQTDEPIEFLDISRWDHEPVPPREWAVQDHIPLKQPTLFSGEGAGGKSLLILQLTAAHVLGKPWIGLPAELGPAIYLGAEDDKDEVHRRVADVARHYETTFADLRDGGLHLLSLAGEDALLGAPDRNRVMQPTRLFLRLREAVMAIRPKCVCLDTLADIYGGDENSRSESRQFGGMMRGLAIDGECALVIASHPSLTGINSGTGLSGSTGWHNSVRARMYLKAAKTEAGEEPDKDRRELEWHKNNYGRLGDTIELRWENGVFVRLQGTTSLERVAADQRAEEVFIKILERFSAQERNVSDKVSRSYAPAIFAEEPEAKAAKATKRALVGAMTRLFAANKIHIEPYGPRCRATFRLAAGAKA
jgi:RecA-family ATPase